ncbi:transposase [Kitasatospora aureofaciens]
MSDAEWAVVRPLLPVPGWLRGRGGQPEAYCHRAMLDAVRYLVDNGTKWRAMPADFLQVTWNLVPQDSSRILRRSHVLEEICWAARWCWRRSGRCWAGTSGRPSGCRCGRIWGGLRGRSTRMRGVWPSTC